MAPIDLPQGRLCEDPAADFALKEFLRKVQYQLMVLNTAIQTNATYTNMQTEVVAKNSGGY